MIFQGESVKQLHKIRIPWCTCRFGRSTAGHGEPFLGSVLFLLEPLFQLIESGARLARSRVDGGGYFVVKRGLVQVSLTRRLLSQLELFLNQGPLALLFQCLHFFLDFRVLRIIRIALEMLLVQSQGLPFLCGHLCRTERDQLGHRGFHSRADVGARDNTHQVNGAEHPVENSTPAIRSALS